MCVYDKIAHQAVVASDLPPRQPLAGQRAIHLRDIDHQRALGWPEIHPEDYCHRCGIKNISAWYVANELWKEAGVAQNEIICPQCFTAAWEKATGNEGKAIWELKRST